MLYLIKDGPDNDDDDYVEADSIVEALEKWKRHKFTKEDPEMIGELSDKGVIY